MTHRATPGEPGGSTPPGSPEPLRASRLLLAGVDVVVTADGEVLVLEVNDHPGVLREPAGPDGRPPVLEALADALALRAGGDPCLVTLPECFRLEPPGPSTDAVTVAPASRLVGDFDRSETALGDLSALLLGLRARGVDAALADRPAADAHLAARGAARTVVFDRLPGVTGGPATEVVNTPGARDVCGDKLTTYRVLAAAGVPVVPCVPLGELLRTGTDSGYAVLKPRVGAAGNGVERHAVTALRDLPDPGTDRIAQPWMELRRTTGGERSHRFDLRVLVVGGHARAALARTAGAPADLLDGEPLLTWLTTTGRREALWIDGAATDATGRYLTEELLTRALRAAEAAVVALDGELAARQASGLTGATDHGFARHNGVGGPLDLVTAVPLANSTATRGD
ncbi:hypothetical protein [Kitasatospora sp. NPDC101183]|uniref:hypothetical protein n=1 Tax=Kitasatospora sp. NPDC101183 TaxID=3364100 RepID=UPI0037FE4F71